MASPSFSSLSLKPHSSIKELLSSHLLKSRGYSFSSLFSFSVHLDNLMANWRRIAFKEFFWGKVNIWFLSLDIHASFTFIWWKWLRRELFNLSLLVKILILSFIIWNFRLMISILLNFKVFSDFYCLGLWGNLGFPF